MHAVATIDDIKIVAYEAPFMYIIAYMPFPLEPRPNEVQKLVALLECGHLSYRCRSGQVRTHCLHCQDNRFNRIKHTEYEIVQGLQIKCIARNLLLVGRQ